MIFLILNAEAADRIAARLGSETSGGYGQLSDIAATADGAFVGFSTGSNSFKVLDTASWSVIEVPACTTSTAGAATRTASDGLYWFYTGCEDGSVAAISINSKGQAIKDSGVWSTGTDPVVAVEVDDTYVYAVHGQSNTYSASALSLTDGSVPTGWPTTLAVSAVNDTVLSNGLLVILDGDNSFTRVDLSTKIASTTLADISYPRWVEAWPYESDIFLADSSGTFGFINPFNNVYQGIVSISDEVTAVMVGPEKDKFYASTPTETLVYEFSAGYAGAQLQSIANAGGITEYAGFSGYEIAANSAGEILVLTERPWVDVGLVSPGSGTEGTEVSVSFSASEAGHWQLRLNGTQAGDGELLDEGEIGAVQSQTVTFPIDASFEEGSNRLWVFVEGAGGEGHDAGIVTVNNPPGAITLKAWSGEEAVTAQFATLPDEDISEYQIYLTVTPFSADDWPTGGPTFDGSDKGIDLSPAPGGEGDRITRTFYPLTNYTKYYVAARAVDATGLEGPMSEVKSATPVPTYGAAQLAGETGGFCGLPIQASPALLLLGGLTVLSRRRKNLLSLGLLGVMALSFAPTQALAKEQQKDPSPKVATVALRYGPVTLTDPALETVYGKSDHQMLRFDYGVTGNLIEANFGIGFYQELGSQVSETGQSYGEHVMMTIWPFTADLTGKLDVMYEQPLVPFARVGLDSWLWRENWGSRLPGAEIPAEHIGGGKFGWHYGLGGMILLDSLDRRTADRVEANSGINDTFLVAEYRKTNMFATEGLQLASTEFTLGLKLDF